MGWNKSSKFGVAFLPYNPTPVAEGATTPDRFCVPLRAGDQVHIYHEREGWYHGEVIDTHKTGIFPMSCVKVKSSEDTLLNIVTSALRDWGTMVKEFFLRKEYDKFYKAKELIDGLLVLRRELVSKGEADKTLEGKIHDQLRDGRLLLDLDLVPRTANRQVVTYKSVPAMNMLEIHQNEVKLDAARSGTAEEEMVTEAKQTRSAYHLYFVMKASLCFVGEDSELLFSLYSRKESRYLTEDYPVQLTPQGLPPNVDLIDKLKTVFKDISRKELESDLSLVCRLIRKGRMNLDDKKEKASSVFRRPFGVAVIPIAWRDLINADNDMDFTMQVFSPVHDAGFPKLHEAIIDKTGGYEPVLKAKGIMIGLRLLEGDLSEIRSEAKEFFDGVPNTEKLGFPDVILPGDFRNDLYVTMENADFAGVGTGKNIEITMQVMNSQGKPISDAIIVGPFAPKSSEYRSVIYTHTCTPVIEELVRLNIDPKVITDCHLYFSMRHASPSEKKNTEGEFGFAFMALTTKEKTVIPDGKIALPVYKSTKQEGPYYLKEEPGSKLMQYRKNEVLNVKFQLCSTLVTQNATLYDLLHWSTYQSDLADLLKRVTFIDQLEIIKFLQDMFDALFAILDSRTEEVAIHVFNALIFIIGFLVDEKSTKFTNFRPVLDKYISEHFHGEMAHKHLINCLKYYIIRSDSAAHAQPIRNSIKALEYLFKFIVRSRELFEKSKTADPSRTAKFRKEMSDLLSAFTRLMRQTEPAWVVGAQTMALKYFVRIFNDMLNFFEPSEVGEIAGRFVEAIYYDASKKNHTSAKLALLNGMVTGPLFKLQITRKRLLPVLRHNLLLHVNKSAEELSAVISMISAIIKVVAESSTCAEELYEMRSLYQPMLQLYTNLKLEDHGLDQCVIAHAQILDILLLSSEQNLTSWLSDKTAREIPVYTPCKATEEELALQGPSYTPPPVPSIDLVVLEQRELLEVVYSFMDILHDKSPFPESWCTFKLSAFAATNKMLRVLHQVLHANYVQGDNFSLDLCTKFVHLAERVIHSPMLQLNQLRVSQRRVLLDNYGDMRLEACGSLLTFWTMLDTRQADFTPSLVPNFLSMTLINNMTLRKQGLDMYFAMFEREYNMTGAFKGVERETVDMLDSITARAGSDSSYISSFHAMLSTKISACTNAAFAARATTFLDDMKRMLSLLLAIRSLPNTAAYEDDRTIATLKLMEYLKQTGRTEAYEKYVLQLVTLHVAAGNFTEAAMTLLKICDLLNWSDTKVPALEKYPPQSMRDRRLAIYAEIVDYFDKGKEWERGIVVMKEMKEVYLKTYDYVKIADLYRKMAQFYVNIATQERFFSEYFRVGYYGKGFSASLQNKEFVYRGAELERLSEFVARIMSKFPRAEIMKVSSKPPESITNGDGQWIQVYNVKPSSFEEIKAEARAINMLLPKKIAKFYSNTDVQVFRYDRPLQKGDKKSVKENEFATLWLEHNFMITEEAFPTVHRRSAITSWSIREVSPLENAVNSVKSKNDELKEIIGRHAVTGALYTSPFTMALNGTVDAAVNGGVNMYKKAFFQDDYVRANPTHMPLLQAFKDALREQLDIILEGMRLHKTLVPVALMGLHDHLDNSFIKMKEELTENILNWNPTS